VKLNYDFIRACAFAASHDATRAYLCGVMVKVTSDKVTYVATDGHQLVEIETKNEGYEANGFIIPARVIPQLSMLLPPVGLRGRYRDLGSMLDVTVSGDGKLEFKPCIEGQSLLGGITAQAVNGEYPDWKRVIPKDADIQGFKSERGLTFCFNWTFMVNVATALAAFRGLKKKSVPFGVEYNGYGPARVRVSEGDNVFTAAVMPCRV
jgi:hypothetical protein